MDIQKSGAVLQYSEKCVAGDRPDGADQNDTAPAHVWDPVAAADAPGVRGECSVPMVSGLRATGEAATFFCGGKLCVLPTVPGRTVNGDMYHKGERAKQFAYEAHTVCDRHGMILRVEVTEGKYP